MLAPVYDRLFAALPYIALALVTFVLIRCLNKVSKRIKSKHNSRIEVGSTNDWFNWSDFKEWNEKKDQASPKK